VNLVEGGWITSRITERSIDLCSETITQRCDRCPDVIDCLREAIKEFMIFKMIVERSEERRN